MHSIVAVSQDIMFICNIPLLLLFHALGFGYCEDNNTETNEEREFRLRKSTYTTALAKSEPTRDELIRSGYSLSTCTVIVERIVCQQLTAKVPYC